MPDQTASEVASHAESSYGVSHRDLAENEGNLGHGHVDVDPDAGIDGGFVEHVGTRALFQLELEGEPGVADELGELPQRDLNIPIWREHRIAGCERGAAAADHLPPPVATDDGNAGWELGQSFQPWVRAEGPVARIPCHRSEVEEGIIDSNPGETNGLVVEIRVVVDGVVFLQPKHNGHQMRVGEQGN